MAGQGRYTAVLSGEVGQRWAVVKIVSFEHGLIVTRFIPSEKRRFGITFSMSLVFVEAVIWWHSRSRILSVLVGLYYQYTLRHGRIRLFGVLFLVCGKMS